MKKITYQMALTRERTTKTKGASKSLVEIFSFFSLSLLVKSIEEEIQPSRVLFNTTKLIKGF